MAFQTSYSWHIKSFCDSDTCLDFNDFLKPHSFFLPHRRKKNFSLRLFSLVSPCVQKISKNLRNKMNAKTQKNIRKLRCDNSGENLKAISRLAKVRCPAGLAFDVERQTCDWKTNVKNCNEVESKSKISGWW